MCLQRFSEMLLDYIEPGRLVYVCIMELRLHYIIYLNWVHINLNFRSLSLC